MSKINFKKIFSKKVILPIIAVILIVSTICIFFVTKNRNNSNTNVPDASNVNQVNQLENQINTDVINKKVCSEYNGNYKYKGIVTVSFENKMTYAEENDAYKIIDKRAYDKNSFLYYLNIESNNKLKSQIITLVDGKYTKSNGSTRLEYGLYYGNLNKSYVYKADKNGTIEIDGEHYSITHEVSQTGYWLANNNLNNGKNLYVIERRTYQAVSKTYSYYITYLYEMI